MTWSNYGSFWELNHTPPVKSFSLSDSEQRSLCFDWVNVRPLECVKNRIKNTKVDHHLFQLQQINARYFISHLDA